jgi:ribosome maturation factor RimP
MFEEPTPTILKGDAAGQIEAWLLEFLQEPEYQHAFILEIKVAPNNKVEVFIDSDERVDFDLCRRVSRHLEEHLDETLLLGERYTLEVSSPGTARPLTNPRQFAKHVGRTLIVNLNEGDPVEGTLTEVTSDGLKLEEQVLRREKKKKIKELVTHQIAFGSFSGAKVKLSFK